MAVTIDTAGTYAVVRSANANADSTTGWSLVALAGSGSVPSLVASIGSVDLVREGTDAVSATVSKRRIQILFTLATGYDFTSGSTGTGTVKVPNGIPYIWANFLASGSALTQAAGGMQLTLGDGTNTRFYNVAGSDTYTGDFRKWAVDPVNAAFTGSAVLGDITEIGFVADVGGTTTRFANFVVDALDVGNGLTFQGTTTTDLLFRESAVVDDATAIGVLQLFNGIIFSQGSLEFSGTAQTSVGETLVFTDTLLTAYTYACDITGTVTFTNSSVLGSGTVDFNFDSSGATSFTMSGGSIAGFNTLALGSGQSIDGVVFSGGGTSTIPNAVTNSTFNGCGLVTVTGSLTGCTVSNSTAASAVSTAALANLTDCTFVSDGTGHAVDLGTVSATATVNWENTLTSVATEWGGSAGTTVGVSGTANDAILVNVASGQTLTVSVAAGATTPSIRNTGPGTVTITAGLVTLTLTGIETGSDVVITSSDTVTVIEEADAIAGTTYAYTYAYSPSTFIDIKVIKAGSRIYAVYDYELGDASAQLPIAQQTDRAYGT